MNIQKMLNVFILIFVIINLGLFIFIQGMTSAKYTLSDDRVEQLERILTKNNISFQDNLPDFYPKSILRIAAPKDLETELVEGFMAYEEQKFTITETSYTHSTSRERLTFDQLNDIGRVFYGSSNPIYVPKNLLEGEKKATANRFVKDFTLNEGDFELTDEREGSDFSIYYYNESYQKELIFSNEVVIKMATEGITEARMLRYIPYGFVGQKEQIYAIDEALYKFMTFIRKTNTSHIDITDIDLGYALGPGVVDEVTWLEIEPYYRLKLGTGQTYYINAFQNTIYQP